MSTAGATKAPNPGTASAGLRVQRSVRARGVRGEHCRHARRQLRRVGNMEEFVLDRARSISGRGRPVIRNWACGRCLPSIAMNRNGAALAHGGRWLAIERLRGFAERRARATALSARVPSGRAFVALEPHSGTVGRDRLEQASHRLSLPSPRRPGGGKRSRA